MSDEKENMIEMPPPLDPKSNDESTNNDKEKKILDALNLSWCFGFNNKIGLLNLCVNESQKMFFVSSHIGIIYDFKNNTQKLLQGHQNNISCCTISDDKRWLITADSGPDSTIIIWDTNTCTPVQTYFNPHLDGTLSVVMTNDSKYVASIGANYPQVLAIWEWTTDSDLPICTAQLEPKYGPQTNIRFNLDNYFYIVTNSPTQTVFYEWSFDNGFVYYAPIINEQVTTPS
jgi:cilia- and flagella-associated protein 251